VKTWEFTISTGMIGFLAGCGGNDGSPEPDSVQDAFEPTVDVAEPDRNRALCVGWEPVCENGTFRTPSLLAATCETPYWFQSPAVIEECEFGCRQWYFRTDDEVGSGCESSDTPASFYQGAEVGTPCESDDECRWRRGVVDLQSNELRVYYRGCVDQLCVDVPPPQYSAMGTLCDKEETGSTSCEPGYCEFPDLDGPTICTTACEWDDECPDGFVYSIFTWLCYDPGSE
jgi:hypothetical protein